MPYCPNCGVELAADALKCPLCGAAAVAELAEAERAARAAASLAAAETSVGDGGASTKAQTRERNKLRWEMLSVSALISAVAVCAVNLLTSDTLSWALYPLFSLLFVWIELSALIELRDKPALGLPIAFVALPSYLFALDIVEGGLGWSWPIGIPVAVIVEIAFGLAVLLSSLLRWKPLLAMALFFLAATLSCLGIDGSLSIATKGALRIGWSGVVAAAVVPVSGFLVYVHFRVLKVARLRRLFRM